MKLSTFRIALLIFLGFLTASTVFGQASSRTSPLEGISADKSSPNEQQHAPGSLEEELKAKRAIKYAEAAHKDNLERAQEVSDLGAKLQSSFSLKQSLGREDTKRLDRLHKLAKQLRNKAGGSDSEVVIENAPDTLAEAICRVAQSSESLSKLVQNTPRQVVSTAVIDEANALLQLIELVKQFSRDFSR